VSDESRARRLACASKSFAPREIASISAVREGLKRRAIGQLQ
jgi:hypothetical protein